MIPVMQTRFSKATDGNCLQASLASLLELPLATIPNFAELYGDPEAYIAALERWLASVGWRVQCYKPDGDLPDDAHVSWARARELWSPPGWSLVSGPSRAGDPCDRTNFAAACEHVCVAFDGEVVHDPFPNSLGPAEVCTWWEFTRLNDEEAA